MGRIQQPRELAELKGATRHDPQRYKNEVPKAAYALGQPPANMSEGAQAVWFELDSYAASGVLTCADRLLLELTANLIAEYREDPRAFVSARIGHLVSCLARLGMTPSDRQKLSLPKPEDSNPFEGF